MDRLVEVYASSPLLFWLLGSGLLYAAGTNALWVLRARGVWRPPVGPWIEQIGRFVFYLGIPYLALGGWPRQPFQGLLAPEDLGLVGLSLRWPLVRWLGAIGSGLTVGLAALAILTLAWRNAARDGEPPLRFSRRPWWAILVDGLYLQVHWAFYRTTLAMLWGSLYTGIFGGVVLVLLEWSLNPAWRRGWRQTPQAADQWVQAALALVTALVFLLTFNLGVCLGVHWLLALALTLVG